MAFKFLKLGGRHIAVDTTPKTTKRETLSKIAALLALSEENTPTDRAFFSKVDTSTWSKEQVEKAWAGMQVMKVRGEFNIPK